MNYIITCDTIMAELQNQGYSEGSDQTIRDIFEKSHKVPQTIPYIPFNKGPDI